MESLDQIELWLDDFDVADMMLPSPTYQSTTTVPQDCFPPGIPPCVSKSPRSSEDWIPSGLEDVDANEDFLDRLLVQENVNLGLDLPTTTTFLDAKILSPSSKSNEDGALHVEHEGSVVSKTISTHVPIDLRSKSPQCINRPILLSSKSIGQQKDWRPSTSSSWSPTPNCSPMCLIQRCDQTNGCVPSTTICGYNQMERANNTRMLPPKSSSESDRQKQGNISSSGCSHRSSSWQTLPSSSLYPTTPVPQSCCSSSYKPIPSYEDVVVLFSGVLHHSRYLPFFRYLSYLCEHSVVMQHGYYYYYEAHKAVVDCRNRCWRNDREYGDVPTYGRYQNDLCHAYLGDDGQDYYTELQAKLIERLSSKIGTPSFNAMWMKSQVPREVVRQKPPVIVSPTIAPQKLANGPRAVSWYEPTCSTPVPQKKRSWSSFNCETYRRNVNSPVDESTRVSVSVDLKQGNPHQHNSGAQWRHHRWSTEGRDDMEGATRPETAARCSTTVVAVKTFSPSPSTSS